MLLLAGGRGRDWVKKTCAQRETLTIAGFALDGNERWANKLFDSGLTIPAEINHAVTSLSPEARLDREDVLGLVHWHLRQDDREDAELFNVRCRWG